MLTRIKNVFLTLFCIFLLVSKQLIAQCDIYNTTPISIGQVIIDSANCTASGSITINNVTGGGGQYVYEITSGPVIRIIQSQNRFNALAAGSYTIRVNGCAGFLRDTTVTVPTANNGALNSFYFPIEKISGFNCGTTNNGRYKIYPSFFASWWSSAITYAGGTRPYRYQISTGTDFSAVPFEPGFDSVVIFNNLTASTTYNVRITDACNNFVTKSFATNAPDPISPISVPELVLTRTTIAGSCTGNEDITISFRDSVTKNPYNPNLAIYNKAYWGNIANTIYLRIKIENAVTGFVYADRHIAETSTFGFMGALGSYNINLNGETGLTGPGTGRHLQKDIYSPFTFGIVSSVSTGSDFPNGTPIRVTAFFPGGNHCGTVIPPYSRSYAITTISNTPSPVKIASVSSNCGFWGNKFFRVDYTSFSAINNAKIIDITAGQYIEVFNGPLFGLRLNTHELPYNGLIIGNSYRIISTDTCGNKDSLDRVYNPGITGAAAPTFNETVKAYFKCPPNTNGAFYNIIVHPLPIGYYISEASISGYGKVPVKTMGNWNNTTNTAYLLDTLLPPGTYSYTITWVNGCGGGVTTRPVTITPLISTPQYNYTFTPAQNNTPVTCFVSGQTTITLTGELNNINTSYYIKNIRLTGVPGNYVFPLILTNTFGQSLSITAINQPLLFSTNNVNKDKSTILMTYPILINTGQEGNYQFSIEIACPDGTVIETVTRNITITNPVPTRPNIPDLKFSNALICDANELKIAMTSSGGVRPLRYEYKLSTSSTYTLTAGGGADSIVTFAPAPAPGLIYDLRVTDACGNAVTSKVSTGSLTGNFYIYQFPLDCVTNPFDVRVGTSSILGAYYTWRRNGVIIDQGFNRNQTTITGVSVDVITVEINAFGCYIRNASRTISFSNPCTIIILPITHLKLSASKISATSTLLKWKAINENEINYFDVEKSSDGRNFKYATRIGANEDVKEYSYSTNEFTSDAFSFYRIKMYDFTGKVLYSNIVKIQNKVQVSTLIQVSPNPAFDQAFLSIKIDKPKPLKLNIYNDKGQFLKQMAVTTEEAINGKRLDLSTLSSGAYFINIIDNWDILASTKFIKQ